MRIESNMQRGGSVQQRPDNYYQRRANEEMTLAAKAEHPQATIAHQQLAAFFLRAAAGSAQSPSTQAGRIELDMGEASREQGFRLNGCR